MTKFKKTKTSIDDRIQNSKFDFCKNLKWMLIAPIAIIIVGIVLLCTLGFNLGIDFTGGTNMKIFVNSDATISDQVYNVDTDLNTIENLANQVLAGHGLKVGTIQKTKMDVEGLGEVDAVIIKFQNPSDDSDMENVNKEIRFELLQKFGFVKGEDVTVDNFESEDFAKYVENEGFTSASASGELMMKSFIALLVAVVLILIYVIIRFEFTSGLASILAIMHDVLITASIVLICRIQINVSFIAALITILGYSINNNIIIFDRMREELKLANQQNLKIDNNQIANTSVKDSLMRSILTGLTTFVMIFMITVIGVADIREFAFPIMIGILAGFYSSVFITPGLWAIAYKPKNRKKVAKVETKTGTEVEVLDNQTDEQ